MKQFISKKNRSLLLELVRTDFKLRYQGSALGYAWSLLRPLMLFVILYLVFVRFLKVGKGIEHYPVYLLLGIVLWNFFAEMTMQSLGSIVGRGDLIRKISIPRGIIVVSTSISALINLTLNLLVVFLFVFINKVDITLTALWLPLIIVEIYLFAIGLSLFLAAAYVKYRDVNYIWEVILQALFYLTPILYPLSLITNLTFQKIIFISPMSQAIQDARYNVVTHQAVTINSIFGSSLYRFTPFLFCLVTLIIGLIYFHRQSAYFAENI